MYYISEKGNILWTIRDNINPTTDKDILSSEHAAKQHSALMQLHQLRDCYRQGWFPDYENNEYKYKIVCDEKLGLITIKDKSSWTSPFLVFQSEEIAEKFLNNFRELIRTAGDLIVS